MNGQSLSHTAWDCKSHVVWIPKYREKSLYKNLRQYVGLLLRDLASQKECRIEEGHLMADHVHICVPGLSQTSLCFIIYDQIDPSLGENSKLYEKLVANYLYTSTLQVMFIR
jgi:putative transposase